MLLSFLKLNIICSVVRGDIAHSLLITCPSDGHVRPSPSHSTKLLTMVHCFTKQFQTESQQSVSQIFPDCLVLVLTRIQWRPDSFSLNASFKVNCNSWGRNLYLFLSFAVNIKNLAHLFYIFMLLISSLLYVIFWVNPALCLQFIS